MCEPIQALQMKIGMKKEPADSNDAWLIVVFWNLWTVWLINFLSALAEG